MKHYCYTVNKCTVFRFIEWVVLHVWKNVLLHLLRAKQSSWTAWPSRWRHYVPLKCQEMIIQWGSIICHETRIFRNTTVRNSSKSCKQLNMLIILGFWAQCSWHPFFWDMMLRRQVIGLPCFQKMKGKGPCFKQLKRAKRDERSNPQRWRYITL